MGQVARPDEITCTGRGGGWRGLLLRAEKPALLAWQEMSAHPSYQSPLPWTSIDVDDYDGVVLAGGHHIGMREYLGSALLQQAIARFFAQDKLVAAICHGALLVARATRADGRSVLHGRRAATVPGKAEDMVWRLCHRKFGDDYGKPYPVTAEEEIRSLLASGDDLVTAMPPLRKDGPGRDDLGLCIRDGGYISARMPHDAFTFAKAVTDELRLRSRRPAGVAAAAE